MLFEENFDMIAHLKGHCAVMVLRPRVCRDIARLLASVTLHLRMAI